MSRKEIAGVTHLKVNTDPNFKQLTGWCRVATIVLRSGDTLHASCAMIGNIDLYGVRDGDRWSLRDSNIVTLDFE